MRWSTLFTPTLRTAPADAEAVSHRLLLRGGFIRQLVSGHYVLLPLCVRVVDKVISIIEEEMDRIGGQRVRMPVMHPAALWAASGRLDSMGSIMFRLRDRHDAHWVLGVTAEELFATVAAELTSYRQLPQIWYQVHTKFRDEPRPKGGLLRLREFTMKDSYSFDLDDEGLDASFRKHHDAYCRIFERLGLDAVPVEASSGNMGGSDSIEFMVAAPPGEDDTVRCRSCGYAANVEKATSVLPPVDDSGKPTELQRFPTPGVRTIAGLEAFDSGAAATDQIKTLVYLIDDTITLVLLRGDHLLNEQKLLDATGAIRVRPATADEARVALGAGPGSLGAVHVTSLPVIADSALQGRTGMVTGANQDDWHVRGVAVARDLTVELWADLRQVQPGEACIRCREPLEHVATIEAGHIFKLGGKYAQAFGATVLDQEGTAVPLVMGSYGIGIERNIAAIVETHHDDKGIVWPVNVAPYEVVITIVHLDADSLAAAETLYDDLRGRGIDVLLDDRDLRPGVKFADAEVVGFPWRVTLGPRTLAKGLAEVTDRSTLETDEVALPDVATHLVGALARMRT